MPQKAVPRLRGARSSRRIGTLLKSGYDVSIVDLDNGGQAVFKKKTKGDDFKPASVDPGQDSVVEVGDGNQVTVTVPHVEGSGVSQTIYKGNKRPCPKECVLIIDHAKGTFTLEKLSNNIHLKKTRIEGKSRAQSSGRPLTPVEHIKAKSSPSKAKVNQMSPPSIKDSPIVRLDEKGKLSPIGDISSSDSDSDMSSSDDSDTESKEKQNDSNMVTMTMQAAPTHPKLMSTLSADLQLSDSDSDSD